MHQGPVLLAQLLRGRLARYDDSPGGIGRNDVVRVAKLFLILSGLVTTVRIKLPAPLGRRHLLAGALRLLQLPDAP